MVNAWRVAWCVATNTRTSSIGSSKERMVIFVRSKHTLLVISSNGSTRFLAVEKIAEKSQLVVQLEVGVLYIYNGCMTLMEERDKQATHLERHFASASRAETSPTIHAHHSGAIPTSLIITDRPPLIVLRNMFTYPDFELRLQAAFLNRLKAGRAFNAIRCEEILLDEKESDFARY